MAESELQFSDEDYNFITSLVKEKTGIHLAPHKRPMVYSRLVRRLRNMNIKHFHDYCEYLSGNNGKEELVNFVNAITTNVTSFFREKHHFTHMANHVLTPLFNSKERRIRIWSAGCSSGMEAYTIAMMVKEAMMNKRGFDVKILATDIDTNVLDSAIQGEYPEEELKNIPEYCHNKYLEHIKDMKIIRMAGSLRNMISFKQLNLLDNWPMKGPFDAIFCRNVVIYFDKKTQRDIFDRYANILKDKGWLYIGHSENLMNVSNRFQLVGRTIYRKII